MHLNRQVNPLFKIEILPSDQFHLISPMAPFTIGEKRESFLYASQPDEGEQINLVVKDKTLSSIAGAAVVRVRLTEVVIVDFYILQSFRGRGAGRALMHKIEELSSERGIHKINTGKSLHADNTGMIKFLQKMGFVKTPMEIYYFSQPLSTQKKRIQYISKLGYKQFIPENNRIVPFTREYFEPVYEMALEIFSDNPFYSEPLLYQILLISSEKYSHILIEKDRVNPVRKLGNGIKCPPDNLSTSSNHAQNNGTFSNGVNGFAIFSTTGNSIHLHFIAIRDKLHQIGLSTILVGAGLFHAYNDGKTGFSYIAYKTDKLFKDIRQIFKKPNYISIQMEKTV